MVGHVGTTGLRGGARGRSAVGGGGVRQKVSSPMVLVRRESREEGETPGDL